MEKRYIFILAQPDSAQWLKEDIRTRHPELTSAFSRPGLYTFKCKEGELKETFVPQSPFVRHFGFSLGPVASTDELRALLPRGDRKLGLHVVGRDEGEDRPAVSSESLNQLRQSIIGEMPGLFHLSECVPTGDDVINVIVSSPSKKEEPWFIGVHRQTKDRSVLPGAIARIPAPPHAPSRAWSKIEEMIAWAKLPVRKGQVAIEIGCAPGGAVLSLTDRGLHVTGIDPAIIEASLFDHVKKGKGSFVHLQCAVGEVERAKLPRKVDWLLCDANLPPTAALRYLAHWSKELRPHLKGIVFTLKLNDERMVAAIPRLLKRAGELGFGPARAVQLPSNRREIAVLCTR